MKTVIKVGELRRIMESANEVKPVMFGHEESKKINQKAYSDIKKETDAYDGGLVSKKKAVGGGIMATDNKGMGDLRYDSISKPFKEKAEAQMKGYVSKDAYDKHKDDEFGNATFDNEGNIYKDAKEHAKMVKKGHDAAVEIGLTGRELNRKDVEDNDETMYESKKIKCLNFKKTKFLSEGHMLSNVPDEYKKEGNRFIMKDNSMNEYLVEWHNNGANVTKKPNLNVVNEERERIKQLWGYKSADAFKGTNAQMRINEDKEVSQMLDKARKLLK